MKVFKQSVHMVFTFILGGIFAGLLLAGCGGGGGSNPNPPGGGAKVTTLQGAAFVPGGGATPKPTRNKPLPENGPFIGAKVEVLNLTSGISYPLGGLTLAGTVGEFKIQDVPTGHDYLVKVRKGNMVVMKVIRIPEEAPNPFDIGEVDAESTSVALMLEHFIREVLGRDDFDITRPDNNVDPAELEDAVRNSDLAAMESLVAELAAKVKDLENDLEALENELAAHNGSEDGVAVVNVYNTVFQILNISNSNIGNEGPDAIHDWRDDGQVGGTSVVTTRVEAEFDEDRLLISISVDVDVVLPADFLEFLKDAVKPQTTIRSGPANPTTETSAIFTFDSSREGSTFRCKLDGEESDCVSPKEYSGLSLGRHDFCVVAKDKEGVEDPSPACLPWVVLSQPEKPDTKIDSTPPNPSSANSATFRSHAEIKGVPLPGATFECSLDSEVYESCLKTKTYTSLSEGVHTFKVKATDATGNTDDSPAEYTWTVDTVTLPEAVIDSGPSGTTSNTSATFTFRAELNNVLLRDARFECALDGSDFSSCPSPKTYSSLAEGPHVFMVKAINASGVADASPAQQNWTITPPIPPCAIFCEDFESGLGTWSAENGVWDVGAPTSGPNGCFNGAKCAATELAGNYHPNTDSRFVSRLIDLPATGVGEEIRLRFRQWFSYGAADSGQVQVCVWDPATSTCGAWTSEGTAVVDTSGWSLKDVDLTAYAGEAVLIAFSHAATDCGGGGACTGSDTSTGWYIDNIEVVKIVPTFTGDFEAGWGDWGADRGVWQVGTPTAGPADCDGSTQCAGTELSGNYGPNTDSRLVSPTIQLPTVSAPEGIHLRFRQWFSYAAADLGQVQVSLFDRTTGIWGDWNDVGTPVQNSSGWSTKDILLTAYAGQIVRIAFYHTAADCGGGGACTGSDTSTGWYIDEITIEVF